MTKTFYDSILRISELDRFFCCCLWPITVLWRFLSLPCIRSSILTRLRFVTILLLVTLLCMLLLSSISWKILSKNICSKIGYQICEMVHGPAPIYRIYFGTFLFFFASGLFMLGIEDSQCWRSVLYNKFWTLKMVVLILIVFGTLLIPRSPYSGEIWHFFGLNAAFMYVVLQFLFLLDTVHNINARIVLWIETTSERSANYCFFILWLPTSILYLLTIFATATFYKDYSSRTDCFSNLFFICFHVYMCAAATFISIHPAIQKAKPKSGLLQSAVVSGYSTYMLWMTLSNEPDEACNPTREYLYPVDPLKNFQIFLSIVFVFFVLYIFSIRIVDYPQYGKQPQYIFNNRESFASADVDDNKDIPDKFTDSVVKEDELHGVEYSYSFFLFTLSLASLYLMMSITNWYRPEEEENLTVKLMAGWGAIWIKLCGGIFCVFIYIWSLVAPVIFPHSYKDLCFYEIMFSTSSDESMM